jgi:hypothetical protein
MQRAGGSVAEGGAARRQKGGLTHYGPKWADAPLDRGVRYLKARFPQAQAWQISATGTKDYQSPEGVRVAPALRLLERLI